MFISNVSNLFYTNRLDINFLVFVLIPHITTWQNLVVIKFSGTRSANNYVGLKVSNSVIGAYFVLTKVTVHLYKHSCYVLPCGCKAGSWIFHYKRWEKCKELPLHPFNKASAGSVYFPFVTFIFILNIELIKSTHSTLYLQGFWVGYKLCSCCILFLYKT